MGSTRTYELNELAIEGALREVREECGLKELTLLSQNLCCCWHISILV